MANGKDTTSWNVYIPTGYEKTKWIDTIYGDTKLTVEEVKDSLINHDGYPANIIVKRIIKQKLKKLLTRNSIVI